MKKLSFLFIVTLAIFFAACEKDNGPSAGFDISGKIFTIAGNGKGSPSGAFGGDGGPASAASLWHPQGIAIDRFGNIYIADVGNQRIRKINNGIISTFAGDGNRGYSGDGGLATAAEINGPIGIVVDNMGNVYFSDQDNYCIRKVSTNGIISTYAGNGTSGFLGDGGPATNAELSLLYGLGIDRLGNLYIADNGNIRIRMVNTSGVISTIAGTGIGGFSGDGGPATAAQVWGVEGVAVDSSRNIYIADYIDNRIRKVNTNGIITTIAGNGYGAPFGGADSGDGGPATAAELYNPTDVAVDGQGNVYIADADNNRIRKVNLDGVISAYAGTGKYGYTGDGGWATMAKLAYMQGIKLDAEGNLYVADIYFDRIRIVYK